jgi:hypothetical protein
VRSRVEASTPLDVLRASLVVFALAIGTYGLAETDIWGHLRFGLDILRDRAIPAIDPYSFTTTGRWVNHEWFSQVMLALMFDTGGLPLLAAYRAAVFGAFLWILYAALRATAWPLRDVLLLATALAASSLSRSVRPQMHSLPLFALTLFLLARDARGLPLVFVAWANLHGGWMIGLGAVVIWAATGPSRQRIGLAIACGLATLVNPYGVGLWWSLLEALVRGWGNVVEWQPVTAWSLGVGPALVWTITAAAAVWAVRRRAPDRFAAVWVVLVAAASFRVSRHLPFFAISVTILVGAPIAGAAPGLAGNRWGGSSAAIVAVFVIGVAVAAAQLVVPTATCLPSVAEPGVRPEASAVHFIRSADLRGRAVMWFDWGLYAIWHVGDRLRVSIDNRRETVYSDRVVDDHARFYEGHDPAYPDRVGADYVWLSRTLPPVDQLVERGWFSIYEGPRSVILSRTAFPPVTGEDSAPAPCFPSP